MNRVPGLLAIAAGGTVTLGIVWGSRGLRDFDWALLPYALASVCSAAAITYRYAVWLRRPPTWRYWVQGWRLALRRPLASAGLLLRVFADSFVAQRFIGRRSPVRWVMHLCLSWGTVLAFGITFPLVFGWIRFETAPGALSVYRLVVLDRAVGEFPLESAGAWLVFNALNVSAVLVLVGVALALRRRLTEGGALALRQLANDMVPLLLLSAVATTGLGLTVSARWLGGHGFGFVQLAHMAAVLALLCWLPFGKLFHPLQQMARLGVAVYKQAMKRDPEAQCARCRTPFASRMQVEDLERVLDEMGTRMALAVCSACRRRLWVLAQGRALGR